MPASIVKPCGGDIGVPHGVLHLFDVGVIVQGGRCKRRPHGVGGVARRHAERPFGVFSEYPIDGIGVQSSLQISGSATVIPDGAEEGTVPICAMSSDVKVGPNTRCSLGIDGHGLAISFSLSLDPEGVMGFSDWGSFLRNAQLTSALLDRLTASSHVINMKECKSLRHKLDE